MHRNCELLFERYARRYFASHSRVLEIGPACLPSNFAQSLNDPTIRWDTLDIGGNPGLTYREVSPYSYPIDDGIYDIVLSANVLEHIPRIWAWINEVARVCRAGGHVITISPASWPYHEAPVDCWRTYPEGMRALYEEAGLNVLFCQCESLEAEGIARVIPGRGLDWQSREELETAARLVPLGGTTECSFDTVTIGRKLQSL